MSLPVKRKLRITQGATFNAGWRWKPGGVPADFTGCRARMQVRPDIDSPAVLLELTTENGFIELRPAMTTGLVGFVDVASPSYFGYATYIVVGATPYNMPGAQHGELRIVNMPGGPTSVTTQSFSLDGLRFAQG